MADGMSGYTSFMGNKDDTLGTLTDSRGGLAFKNPDQNKTGLNIKDKTSDNSSMPGQEGIKDTGRNMYGYGGEGAGGYMQSTGSFGATGITTDTKSTPGVGSISPSDTGYSSAGMTGAIGGASGIHYEKRQGESTRSNQPHKEKTDDIDRKNNNLP
jgi:hypothetical protein